MSVHLSVTQAARLGVHGATTPSHRPRARRSSFDWAEVLAAQIVALRLPQASRELLLVPGRKFRTDLAWPDRLIFAEVDGAEWTHGRHGRGLGMRADCTKWNALMLDGWTGFQFVGSHVRNGYAVQVLEQALCGRAAARSGFGIRDSGRTLR